MGSISRSSLQVKRARTPDEMRAFKAHGHVEVHKIGEGNVMRGVFEPGWKWSNDVGPIAGTKSCMAPHMCFVVSGRMKIRMDDGSEAEVGPGDFFKVDPGHDAWVVGNEPCVLVDFGGYADYAKAPGAQAHSHSHDRLSAS